MTPTPQHPRAEDELRALLPFGRVVTDRRGYSWVFIGWNPNTSGREAVFIREVCAEHRLRVNPWQWRCSYADTIRKKFPSLNDAHES